MPDRTVSDVIVAGLSSWGVEYIFGLPGTSCLGLVDAIRRQEGMTFVKVRHEEAAALMASAYAKLTGKVGSG
jgi:pyruvate oxidase/acetolactate synthase-1/2/3 large subunit